MMNKKRKYFGNIIFSGKLFGTVIAVIAVLGIPTIAQNQSFKIDNVKYSLDEIQKITFSETDVILKIHDGTQEFSPFSIWYFSTTISIPTDNTAEPETVIHVHPNPVSDILYVEGKEPPGIISIYDVNGDRVISVNAPEAKTSLDLSNLRSGFYFMKTNNQTVKIVKK